MSSYHRTLYHIVFRTKYSHKTLNQEHSKELYKYMTGFIKNKNCHLLRINGMQEHLHVFCEIRPSISLADFMRDLKASSSKWLKQSGKFPKFRGWAVGYGAFTYSWRDKDMIINYIKYQQKHHKSRTPDYELKRLLKEQGIEADAKFFP